MSLLFRQHRKAAAVLGALLVAWTVVVAFLFVWPPNDPPGHADAVVVLSGGRNWRLDPALKLMREGVAPILVISGSGYDSRWLKARRLCRNGASGFRVICFDPKPFSTQGEAETIARLARAHGWKRVDVVTSRYHIVRAGMLVRRCYHGHVAMIGAHYPLLTAPLDYIAESLKLLYQVTVERSC